MDEREKAERWKDVPSLPDYRVSSWGRVRFKGRNVKLRQDRYGAVVFNAMIDGAYTTKRVARLVGEAFCPDFNESLRPRYRDGCPAHCFPSNLMWDLPNAGRRDERTLAPIFVHPRTLAEAPAKETCKHCRQVASKIKFLQPGTTVPSWSKQKKELNPDYVDDRKATANCIYHYCNRCDHEWVGPTWISKVAAAT